MGPGFEGLVTGSLTDQCAFLSLAGHVMRAYAGYGAKVERVVTVCSGQSGSDLNFRWRLWN